MRQINEDNVKPEIMMVNYNIIVRHIYAVDIGRSPQKCPGLLAKMTIVAPIYCCCFIDGITENAQKGPTK